MINGIYRQLIGITVEATKKRFELSLGDGVEITEDKVDDFVCMFTCTRISMVEYRLAVRNAAVKRYMKYLGAHRA
jgi:hypothetical protein